MLNSLYVWWAGDLDPGDWDVRDQVEAPVGGVEGGGQGEEGAPPLPGGGGGGVEEGAGGGREEAECRGGGGGAQLHRMLEY